MKPERHLEKAKRLEKTIARLLPSEDWELILEGIYGISLQYGAYICDKNIGYHPENYVNLPKFLDENSDVENVPTLLREIEKLRTAVWKGGQKNGDIVKKGYSILKNLKSELEKFL